MMGAISSISLLLNLRGTSLAISAIVFSAGSVVGPPAIAQATTPPVSPPAIAQDTAPPPTPGDNIRFGYVIHQSVDFGGHIVTQSGSSAMYDTLVNIQSGPRLLDSSFQMVAVNPAHALLFDRLSSSSFGYGGDPIDGTFMNVSKGRIYNFQGNFRRYRQYFDYNLLANPSDSAFVHTLRPCSRFAAPL
jgi:hypothetical protein